jgi:antitoxin-like ribbon-helix-helix protein
MSKRPSLADTMRNAVQSQPDVPIQTSLRPRTLVEREADLRRFHAATREGKKKVTGNLPPSTHKLLKALAVERETTTEALLAEAILDLLTKYNVRDRAA